MNDEDGSGKFTRDALALTGGLAAGQLTLAGLTRMGLLPKELAFGSPAHVARSTAAFGIVLATGLGVAILTKRALFPEKSSDMHAR